MTIRSITHNDAAAAAVLAARLYSADADELLPELLEAAGDPQQAVFLTWDGSDAVAFAQVSLRHDYVEGTHSSPVGYLEGIYVSPAHRQQGLARALVEACRDWARDHGCSEFASDTPLHNTGSQAFHRALGFTEAERIVCYTQLL